MAAKVEKKQINTKSHSRGNEIFALILLALTILVFLSLVSYNPNDPTFNTESSYKTQNWIGPIGANLAEFLMTIVGVTAYLLPALLGLIAWRFFRSESLRLSVSRIIGYLFFVFSVSSLAVLFKLHGGLTGVFFEGMLAGLLGRVGTGILLGALFLTSLLLITNFSFASLFGSFGMAWENFRVHFDEWRGHRRETREEKNQKIRERTEKRLEARGDKPEQKTPTISIGDTVTAIGADGKKDSNGGKISSVFSRFKVEPEQQKEEKTVEIIEESQPEEIIEEEIIPPTISSSEDDSIETEDAAKPIDLVAESEKIPITPIRETGELLDDNLILEAIEEEPPAVVLPRKPQNFENYILPGVEFLTEPIKKIEQKEDELLAIAKDLTEKTKEFNVTGQIKNIGLGPVVTTFEFKPDPGVKYSRVTGLVDDLCLALKAESIRIERIPGKAVVGIEVPNKERETIFLRDVIDSDKFKQSDSRLTIALGKRIDGIREVADLAKMPHLLIAGSTGAGKSVGVNTLIVSILYKAKPDEVKFIMVDPKRLELGLYADIPHLATPIITDPKRAAISLKWAVSEMERRYKDLAGWGVRNIDGFNTEVRRRNSLGEFDENGEPRRILPYVVIIIDELADLMMTSGKEVEESITRLAQMARAVGIHLVLATQRPSVDVITGLIKANFPARISFRVSSKVDSRTIIDSNGAEQLLGRGDMLFLPPATSQIIRVHGAFVDEKEIAKIVEHIKKQGSPEYDTTITKTEDELDDAGDLPGRRDALFLDALKTVVSSKRASTSLLQRHLRIGYGRAAAILDAMVHEGYIGDMDGSTRARAVTQKAYEALQEVEEGREL